MSHSAASSSCAAWLPLSNRRIVENLQPQMSTLASSSSGRQPLRRWTQHESNSLVLAFMWGELARGRPTRWDRVLLRGRVEDGHPFVDVELLDPAEYLSRVLVDTGFSGALVIPTGTVERWQRFESAAWLTVGIASDEVQAALGLSVVVNWFGSARRVLAVELGSEFIVGSELLLNTAIAITADEVVVRPISSDV